ncbi:MAG: hypothetical protein RL211_2110 [Pseudomonadota bacterium]|jgi:hypothetical protein
MKSVSFAILNVIEFGSSLPKWDNVRTRKNGLLGGRGAMSWCHDFWVKPAGAKAKNLLKSMAYVWVGSSPISHPIYSSFLSGT